ncbi:hypothetical protein [Leisingera aquimarina]|uniref:hypothetical protein n=1 Tax=Leisingera aquimarina TaxID=476529 RepID=UPI0012EC5854|nr:hypothetical protein [Leisingera aquimarina]
MEDLHTGLPTTASGALHCGKQLTADGGFGPVRFRRAKTVRNCEAAASCALLTLPQRYQNKCSRPAEGSLSLEGLEKLAHAAIGAKHINLKASLD